MQVVEELSVGDRSRVRAGQNAGDAFLDDGGLL
jgi:hypothetical protein